jgi:hypothetical protein
MHFVVDANINKSSTHTVIIVVPLDVHFMYAQESEYKLSYPFSPNLLFNSIFHSRPDCFNP